SYAVGVGKKEAYALNTASRHLSITLPATVVAEEQTLRKAGSLLADQEGPAGRKVREILASQLGRLAQPVVILAGQHNDLLESNPETERERAQWIIDQLHE